MTTEWQGSTVAGGEPGLNLAGRLEAVRLISAAGGHAHDGALVAVVDGDRFSVLANADLAPGETLALDRQGVVRRMCVVEHCRPGGRTGDLRLGHRVVTLRAIDTRG